VPSASLPPAPSLEQLRKQAKDLLRAHRAGDPGAVARVAAHDAGEALKLTGAQHVIAREHGFPSWPRLRAYVERVAAHGPDLQHAYHEDLDYYEGRAYGLLASARDGTEGAVAAFHGTHPPAPLTETGARAVVARQHGFASWAALRRHVASLRDSGEPFARAYRAVEAHDVDGLRAQLETFPDLAAAVGTNGNDLLGMAGATCDERLVRALLDAGADPTRGNAHGWTPLHQAAYSNLPLLARMLLDEGVPVDVSARGDGGTPLVIALFEGNRETAGLLAEHGVHPRNLRAAAGLGRLDLVEELVAPDGRLTPEAGAHRAYYRPHSGFPDWRPADDPQEVLDEALAWAARSDRVAVLEPLVARGARLEADVYRGSALMWAAATGRSGAVRRLIELGADPSGRSTFGGPTHGEGVTPLHLAAQGGHLDAVRALLDAGADPTARDAIYDATPDGWAEHGGHPEVAAAIRGG
jgi:ankyrin repeat protein